MPAFTFEKIASPENITSAAAPQASTRKASVGKSRTLIHAMLDRLAIARLKRERAGLPPALPLKPPPE